MRNPVCSFGIAVGVLVCATAFVGCQSYAVGAGSSGATAMASNAPLPVCSNEILQAIPASGSHEMLRVELLECALTTAQSIVSGDVKAMVIDEIVSGLSMTGSYHRAVEVACTFAPDMRRRMMMLREVAKSLAHSKHVDEAIGLVKGIEATPRMEQATKTNAPAQVVPPDPWDTSDVWGVIATEQAKAGEIAQALESLGRSHGSSAWVARIAVVDALLLDKRAEEAQKVLDEAAEQAAVSAMQQPEALEEVAVRYAALGQKERAVALLRDAIQKLYGQGKWAKGARDELVVGLGRVGLYQEATDLLTKHGELQHRLVVELTKTGEMGPAGEVAATIRDGYWRARAMATLAEGAKEKGDARGANKRWEEAREAAVSVAGARFKVEALVELAVRMAGVGRSAEAETMLSAAVELATSIQDGTEKELAVREAAVGHAKIKRCVRALEVGRIVGDSGYTIRAIAAHCADPGDYETIHARVEDIEHEDQRGQALGDLAKKYALAGRFDEGVRAIGQIRGDVERARALAAMGNAGLPEGGGKLGSCPGRR